MVDVSSWSETPASNTTVDGVSIAEGCSPGNLNNGLRSIMAGIKTYTPDRLDNLRAFDQCDLTTPTINGRRSTRASTVSDSGTIAVSSIGQGIPSLPRPHPTRSPDRQRQACVDYHRQDHHPCRMHSTGSPLARPSAFQQQWLHAEHYDHVRYLEGSAELPQPERALLLPMAGPRL